MLQVRQVISLVTSHPYLPFCRHIIPILNFISIENIFGCSFVKGAGVSSFPKYFVFASLCSFICLHLSEVSLMVACQYLELDFHKLEYFFQKL